MNLVCQTAILNQLQMLASQDAHSILIEGVEGSGKTYLALQYARLLDIPDMQVIDPTVASIRDTIDACCAINNPVVVCIENLDSGVPAASYTLLKFLEEPKSNVYIVITCARASGVPDTIISRSICLLTSPPIDSDIAQFAESIDLARFNAVKDSKLWRCVRTFSDVKLVLSMPVNQFNYYSQLDELVSNGFNSPISTMSWNLGHYPDNSETPIYLVIRYLMELRKNDMHLQKAGIDCLRDMAASRIASHAVLCRFLMEAKYCE